MALARLSLLKSDALLDIDAATWDSELKALLAAATEQVHQSTDRILESTTHTDERHTGDSTNILYPKQYPVTTLSSVSIWDTSTDTFVSESTAYFDVIDQAYLYYPKLGQENNATYSLYPATPNGIKITYIAGYSTTSWATALITASFGVPADLEYVVALMAALKWLEGRGSSEARLGLKRMILNDGQEIIPDRAQDAIEQILSTYRRPNF